MRRWMTVAAAAMSLVAERSSLWVPGALAWMATVGWIALLVGVARAPTIAELTFLGARVVTSGAWPWNAVANVGAALLLLALAIALASVGEAALLRGRRAGLADVGAIFVIGLACVVPLLIATVALGAAFYPIAVGEFNAPETDGGPVLGAALALAPFLVAILGAIVLGSTIHAAATRSRSRSDGPWPAIVAAPSGLRGAGSGALVQMLALLVARIGYLLFTIVLLRVLWAPIERRLAEEGFGLASLGLLVGFIAIWLCLILAGGALHAWGSVSWTRLLAPRGAEADPVAQMETHSRP
jgi:hypothetical protein